MSFSSSALPPRILKLMSPSDRKSLGKAAQLPEETLSKADARSEKELQSQCVNLLRLRGIEVLWHRTDKRSHATIGWPDLTMCVCGHDGFRPRVWAVALEVKLPGRNLQEHQRNMAKKMTSPPNNWTHRVIHSVQELRTFLEGLGL